MLEDLLTIYPWRSLTHGTDRRIDFSRDPTHDLLEVADRAALKFALQQLCMNTENARKVALILSHSMEKTSKELVARTNEKKVSTCAGCREQFNEDNNPISSCAFYKFHPVDASLNEDSGAWGDTDHPDAYPYDHLPEGYEYECCEREGTDAGCASFRHLPARIQTNQRKDITANKCETIRGEIVMDDRSSSEEDSSEAGDNIEIDGIVFARGEVDEEDFKRLAKRKRT